MSITREDLRWAADQGLLAPGQDETLWRAFESRHAGKPRFDAANVAYYAGALIVIGAMGWYMTKAWEGLGGWGIATVAAGYAVGFVLAGRVLWDRLGLRVPGGLLFTMAVGMTPLFTYGVLRALELWPQGDPGAYRGFHVWIKGSWLTLEIATILAGLVALRFRRFPFLTAPIAVALWYLSMDLFPLLMGVQDFDWEARRWVSLCFGLAMLVGAYAVDLRGRDDDFAFWTYLFGLLAFWGGLSLMDSNSELGKFLYALINLGLIGLSLVLRRPLFVVFGALGVTGYIGHLAYRVFADSLLFPFALTFLGLAIIALGVIYQRNRVQVERMVAALMPAKYLALLPPRARPPAAGNG
jgi:hypothetical protein